VVEQFAALDCVADERERSDLKAKITREIEQTDRALTRAIWESAADFSEGQHSQHPTMLRRTEYRVLRESAIDRFKLTVSDVYRC
jgi:heme-degrading monooxygenase HmoA